MFTANPLYLFLFATKIPAYSTLNNMFNLFFIILKLHCTVTFCYEIEFHNVALSQQSACLGVITSHKSLEVKSDVWIVS